MSLLVVPLSSADDGLYDPAPPPDAAFVRVVHAQPGTGELAPSLGSKSLDALAYQQSSPYVVVPQGERQASFGASGSAPFTVSAGSFYTVALATQGVVLLDDPINTNLTKSLLVIYNLSDIASISLRTADGATTIVDGVAPGTVGHRAVNPLEVTLAAWSGDAAIQAFDTLKMERGEAYSVFVMGTGSDVTAVLVANTTTR